MYLSLQGNMGLSKAIDYFTSHQIPISIPMNDTQKYDLVIDLNNELKKVQVKTSRYQAKSGGYEVQLKNSGGAVKNYKIRALFVLCIFVTHCDYLFILTGADKLYLIPSNIITAKNSIVVGGNRYNEYEVKIKTFSEFSKENN